MMNLRLCLQQSATSDAQVCTWRLALVLLASMSAFPQPSEASTVPLRPRRELDLGRWGAWSFQTNGAPADQWKRVQVPSHFEAHEGTNFNGIGWYRCHIEAGRLPAGERTLLHFDAAATEAEVWVDGERVGSHLGGWTPFRFDVTDLLSRSPKDNTHEIKVRLDEKVGHNTQGFLPIVQPHFGGLWQSVSLLSVESTYIDDLRLRAIGNPATGRLELEVPLAGAAADRVDALQVGWRLEGAREGHEQTLTVDGARTADTDKGDPPGTLRREGNTLRAEIPIPQPRLWSPGQPHLYRVSVRLPAVSGREGHWVHTRAAFRSIQTVGDQLRLNGAPLNIRGLLNWGYYPPKLAPFSDERRFRSDLVFARERGFNLVKFCLWIPPRRYLELCDELGMLAWMEYPTWHPQLTPKFLDQLRREFTEFFWYDRNHPSVILRSLTCETGPGADLDVIRSLYDLAHQMIPGAVIEDDSSWIEWNRVSDIYDDHPYGNNHTWVPTLARLNTYVREHGLKPLVLGEAIAADTWVPREPLVSRLREARPYWAPSVIDRQPAWLDQMRALAGPGSIDRLVPDSLRYGLLMRKYQAEAFRREVPNGGYVISVIRDIPNASMGLIDYLDRPKWPARDWAWQRDTICLLKTDGDGRSVAASTGLRGSILVSHYGAQPLPASELNLALLVEGARRWPTPTERIRVPSMVPGSLVTAASLNLALPMVDRPLPAVLRAELRSGQQRFPNQWPLWIVPEVKAGATPKVSLHSSIAASSVADLLPAVSEAGDRPDPAAILVASRFDDTLAGFLENGGRVLMLPDGGPRSFKLAAHWFLRGAPLVADHPLTTRVPRELLVDLQHFDLAGDVVPNIPFLDEVDPVLLLWDTHDHGTVKTHGLVFETRVGGGRLLVSSLRHTGTDNAAGRWLLNELLGHVANGPAPRRALSPAFWTALKAKLSEDRLALTERPWHFKPDPQAEGVAHGWAASHLDVSDWTEIKVGQHWESQGHPALDGWAWYRLQLEVPSRWAGKPLYLTFEGVDDCYELFIDGDLVAKRGDPATRVDTFNETFSHDLTARFRPGATHVVAVRVYDWYGAGGVFRPVTLGTAPYDPRTEVIE